MSKKISVIGAVVAGALLSTAAPSVFADAAAGEKLYKRERCETCHGPTLTGGGAFPNLLTSPKTATKEAFTAAVLQGQGAMAAFKDNKNVAAGINDLYDFVSSKKPK